MFGPVPGGAGELPPDAAGYKREEPPPIQPKFTVGHSGRRGRGREDDDDGINAWREANE